MSKMVERKVGTFQAKTEQGKIFTIFIMQKFLMADLAFGDTVRQESPISKRLVTSEGRDVNKIDENTYDVFGDTEKYGVTRI